jgi:hypothetical protein
VERRLHIQMRRVMKPLQSIVRREAVERDRVADAK